MSRRRTLPIPFWRDRRTRVRRPPETGRAARRPVCSLELGGGDKEEKWKIGGHVRTLRYAYVYVRQGPGPVSPARLNGVLGEAGHDRRCTHIVHMVGYVESRPGSGGQGPQGRAAVALTQTRRLASSA